MAVPPESEQLAADSSPRSVTPVRWRESRPRWTRGAWRWTRGAWRWTPLGCAAVYVVVLLATLPSVIAAVYRNADVAAAPEIGQLISSAPDFAQTVLGNAPWYSALWFEQLTRDLPGHRTLWELAPWVLTLVGVGLVAWAASRVAGRWAAAIIAVTCACAGTTLLPLQFAWSVHAVSYVHICVLGAFIVPVALGVNRSNGWILRALCVLVALVTGFGIASDKLVIVGGLAPLVVAGAVLWRLSSPDHARRVLTCVAGVAIGAVLVAVMATWVARSQHVVPAPFPITLAAVAQLPGHIEDLVGSLGVLGNASFGGGNPSRSSLLAILTAAVVAIAMYTALRVGRAFAAELVVKGGGVRGRSPRAGARTAFLSYWAASAVLVSAAFVLTSLPRGLGSSRYVVTVAYAVVVILVVLAAGSPGAWKAAVAATGSSAIILAAAVSIDRRQIQAVAYAPSQGVAEQLDRFATREHLTVGYAGYWDASPLTWELNGRLRVYPVIRCGTNLCPFPYHKINTWYLFRKLPRSFFVVDARLLRLHAYGAISAVPTSWGTPTQVAHIGQLTVYVYPYNLAVKLLPEG
ncbi:MAG: hypothetical protein ACJ780_28925 [Solirubrobacteraceae bacterium]